MNEEQEDGEGEEDSERGKESKWSWLQMHLSFLRKFILRAAPKGGAGNWCYLV